MKVYLWVVEYLFKLILMREIRGVGLALSVGHGTRKFATLANYQDE
jgi:hypothetical protein